MPIRPEFRWWLLTLLVIGVLVTISLLALDRQDVVWSGNDPLCPHCRTDVPLYGSRCPTCQQQFDWRPAPEALSPWSPWSLTALEAEVLRERVQDLGEDVAIRRVAKALSISPAAAERYLSSVGRARCGYCGGTGVHLLEAPSGEAPAAAAAACPVCNGTKVCIACGGDRRMRRGDPGAGEALQTYAASLADIPATVPVPMQRAEAQRLNDLFIKKHAGAEEATYLVFWPDWVAGSWPSREDAPAHWGQGPKARTAVEAARRRLDHVLVALKGE